MAIIISHWSILWCSHKQNVGFFFSTSSRLHSLRSHFILRRFYCRRSNEMVCFFNVISFHVLKWMVSISHMLTSFYRTFCFCLSMGNVFICLFYSLAEFLFMLDWNRKVYENCIDYRSANEWIGENMEENVSKSFVLFSLEITFVSIFSIDWIIHHFKWKQNIILDIFEFTFPLIRFDFHKVKLYCFYRNT